MRPQAKLRREVSSRTWGSAGNSAREQARNGGCHGHGGRSTTLRAAQRWSSQSPGEGAMAYESAGGKEQQLQGTRHEGRLG